MIKYAVVDAAIVAISIGTVLLVHTTQINPKYIIPVNMLLVLAVLVLLIFERHVPAVIVAVALVAVNIKSSAKIVAKHSAQHADMPNKMYPQAAELLPDTKTKRDDTNDAMSSDSDDETTDRIQVGSLEASKRNDEIDDGFIIHGYAGRSSFSPANFAMI